MNQTQSFPGQTSRTKPLTQRLMSIDALRGFDMFWIVGAEEIVHTLHKISQTGPVNLLANQLTHVEWRGVRFYDLIFPLFVFIVGVSLVFSLSRTVEQEGQAKAYKRIFYRSLALYLIGIFTYGGIGNGVERIRLLGVLQRISICYLCAGFLFCTFRLRGLIAACIGLLLGYWALMAAIPIRDIQLEKESMKALMAQTGNNDPKALFYSTTNTVTGAYDMGRNLANHVDFQYLPFRKWDTYWDPEGLLSTLPAIGTCLLGVFAGLLLKNPIIQPQQKVIYLLLSGAGSILLGFLWGFQFPIIKKIWTSSYVLVAGGYGAIMLGIFYQIIEIWNKRTWAMPFVWIGTNAITIYLVHNLVDLPGLANRLVGGPVKASLGNYGDVLVTIVVLGFSFLLVNFMYRRKIFLRL